ncbi:hypothetical protein D3O61_15195 [Vibrio vulnificus]|nr:hypothetical protein [Vibrio vulnificus]PNM59151.1 hypothetical protein AL546_011210 [Vibrio vulnificus]POB87811.1 hypothetical protein CRN53_19690 [Vibrio vulnificus]RZQ79427.1 hypothetical protein D8T22_05355 [Vibrio vulnificus]RZR31088.1 hypothetical protein D8T33_17915 [Vibrio vulnificus]
MFGSNALTLVRCLRLSSEKREARSEKREARSEKREARSEKREARSEKRESLNVSHLVSIFNLLLSEKRCLILLIFTS